MMETFGREADDLQLLNVFPEELWGLILANVQDAKEYFRLCATSPLFKNLLSAQRVPVLLTAVVKILLRRRECWKWQPNHWNHALAEQDPRVHLWHFARCRQVSRDWKTGIDHALHNLSCHHQFSKELEKLDHQFYSQVFQNYSVRFDSLNNLNAFEWWFHESHFATGTNPFVTRALEIKIPFGNPELQQFISKLFDVLSKCGKHVWYLTIKGNMSYNYWLTPNLFAHFLKQVLERVSNLKALRYDIHNPLRLCEPLDFQFPLLKKLVFFDQVGLPFEIVKAHLQSAKPTQIGVTFEKETFLDTENTFMSFCQLNTSVSKLRLQLCDDKIYWDGIFSKLETFFGECLTTLCISLHKTGLFVKSKQLRLPSLKVLEFELEEAVPLDFLQGVGENLESLKIEIKNPMTYQELVRARTQERKLKIYQAADCNKLFTSNIWEMFPNLKKLALNGIRETSLSPMECTRKEWLQTHLKSRNN